MSYPPRRTLVVPDRQGAGARRLHAARNCRKRPAAPSVNSCLTSPNYPFDQYER